MLCELAHIAEQLSQWHGVLSYATTSIRSAGKRTRAIEMAVFRNPQLLQQEAL